MAQINKVSVAVERGLNENSIRIISFEHFDGLKSVIDIFEYRVTEASSCDHIGRCMEDVIKSYGIADIVIDSAHDGFDFGRARKIGSKIAKLMKELV